MRTGSRRLMRTDERGSGSLLAVALIAGTLALTMLFVPLYIVLVAKQRVAGAADAAALAAADVAIGIIPGVPCEQASVVADANGAALSGCRQDGAIVTVRASMIVLGLPVAALATAGPAPPRQ